MLDMNRRGEAWYRLALPQMPIQKEFLATAFMPAAGERDNRSRSARPASAAL
jgi:hypothetical protein